VITPNAVRERLSAQTGISFRKDLNERKTMGFLCGTDVKFLEENQFSPDIRTGIGLSVGHTATPHLAFLLEYYHGQLPYSTITYGPVQWFGLSTRLMKGL
jgi:hypothetical protein